MDLRTSGELVSYKQFNILIEATADAAFAVDCAGRISAWNRAAVELFGVNETEAIGTLCHQVMQCSDESGTVCGDRCVIERAVHDKQPKTNFDLRVQTRIGKQWCTLSTLIASDPTSGALHAIHIVHPREVSKRLEQALNEFVRRQAGDVTFTIRSTPAPDINVRLTAREIEVLRSLAKGDSTKKIATQLNISTLTVSNHIKHILNKFDAHTRLEAIRFAERAGVI